jgi:hypothetical protein
MDPDMVVTSDIKELFGADAKVSVRTDQAKFEWASLMVFDNEQCKILTPEYVSDEKNPLFDFAWTDEVGCLPKEWNHCIGYEQPMEAKLYHYTQGIPCWEETASYQADPWNEAFQSANSTVSWDALMGKSVHAKHVINRLEGQGCSEALKRR